ncbi:MAG: acyl-ACP--UDP-N-acetylglucosamine O-acyltransferase [Proteobacteria bacterium]|nr:acyl-ACP--UDP-N-acetylglucosamine O-acyltransferase [Pseudomonadota bacterium]
MLIDSRAAIDPSAKLAPGVKVGPFSFIGPNVEVGEGTVIGANVVITKNTRIGKFNKIHNFAAIGGDPQDLTPQDRETFLEVGDNNIFREFCTINRGSNKAEGITRIGSRNLLMAYIHIGHDCQVGNNTIFANNASIAGHVIVDDFANLGAFAGVHQFVRIGSYSFLGRATKVGQDVLPYMLVTGNPGGPTGLNLVVLRRQKVGLELMRVLKHVYKLFHHRDQKLIEIQAELIELSNQYSEIKMFLDILEKTKRGIARPRLLRKHPNITDG